MKAEKITDAIELPEGVSAEIVKGIFKIKGPKGEIERKLLNPKIRTSLKDNKIFFEAKKPTKREKTLIGTFKAHIRNMIKGTKEGHIYKLRICSGHFPMNASISGDDFIVKNFFGEKIPRILKIKKGAEVKIDGNEVIVQSLDKDIAGQVAADIETLTKIKNRDLRIFQDGIYIIEKSSK